MARAETAAVSAIRAMRLSPSSAGRCICCELFRRTNEARGCVDVPVHQGAPASLASLSPLRSHEAIRLHVEAPLPHTHTRTHTLALLVLRHAQLQPSPHRVLPNATSRSNRWPSTQESLAPEPFCGRTCIFPPDATSIAAGICTASSVVVVCRTRRHDRVGCISVRVLTTDTALWRAIAERYCRMK